MSFLQAIARAEAAIFDRLGEDADWDGIGVVRVVRREANEDIGFTHGTAIVDGYRVRVRKSDVPAPAAGQVLQILDVAGDPVPGALFAVSGNPKLDRKGVWTCMVQPVAA